MIDKSEMLAIVHGILDEYLETNNHRKTHERYTILDAVYGFDGHFTLEQLDDALTTEFNFPVSRATLYNTLKLFIQLRLIVRHPFKGTTKYEACYRHKGHVHQVCTTCGEVCEIEVPQMDKILQTVRVKRFRKDSFALYIYGICSKCQAKQRRKTKQKKDGDEAETI